MPKTARNVSRLLVPSTAYAARQSRSVDDHVLHAEVVVGSRLDLSLPFMDVTVSSGLLLHVVIPDITQTRPDRVLRVGAEQP